MSQGSIAVPPSDTVVEPSPFPDSTRVHYAENPLSEVICQLRFPPVLRIDSELPAQFQERIREIFPLFKEEVSPLPELPPELSQLLKANLTPLPRNIWKFSTEDTNWEVTLTRESIALLTAAYKEWGEFRDLFVKVFDALHAEYHLSFLTRIGLRYQNLISRKILQLDEVPWSDLLQPHIAAEYAASPDLSPAIEEATHRVLITLSDNGKVNLRHGTARRQGEAELLYLIDNDFFTEEKTGVINVFKRLDHFNRESGRLFRWCITKKLHEAMGPTPVT